ncbi:MAG: hypothetical protein QM804_12450 [Propionicimonas sp.]
MSAGHEIGRALRDVFEITLAQPVRTGRPRPSDWPRGLAAIGLAALVVYGALTLAATFAVPLRQWGELTVSPTSDTTLPSATLPLLVAGLLLSLALAHTAALHTSWWLRLPLFVLGGAAIFPFTISAFDRPVQLVGSVLAYLALLIFTIVRSRRDYAWWEFLVVAGLVTVAALLPWAGGGSFQLFADPRPTGLEGALVNLQPLALPAIMVAATAPAQIVVTGAVATGTRPVGRGVFWTGAAVVLAWFLLSIYWARDQLEVPALLGSAVCLALVAIGLTLVLRPREPEPPAVYPETWGGWLYPLAGAIVAIVVVSVPLVLLNVVLPMIGLRESPAGQLIGQLIDAWIGSNSGVLWRALLGLVALGFAWQRERTGRRGEAGFLVSFAVAVLVDASGLLPGGDFLLDRTSTGYGVIAGVTALLVAGWLALRRRLTPERAAGVLTVLLLAVLYPHREVLSDPGSALLVFSGPLVVLFGLTWRILTDAEFTHTSSRLFPQSTRVLLFLANSLFAVTTIAFLALTRGTGTYVDGTPWARTSDGILGDSLFVIALVAGVWLVVRPSRQRT